MSAKVSADCFIKNKRKQREIKILLPHQEFTFFPLCFSNFFKRKVSFLRKMKSLLLINFNTSDGRIFRQEVEVLKRFFDAERGDILSILSMKLYN